MLLWLFRGVFIIVVVSVLVVNASSVELSTTENSASWWAVVISGMGLAIFFLLLDVLTPKRKLSALAGVFFGLLVGMLISGALASAVDMIGESYRIPMVEPAKVAIKWMLGIGICYFTISFDPFVSSQIPAQNEDELILINAQVGRFAAVLCADESPRAITVTGDAPDGIVDVTTRRLDGVDYVFVLNGTAAPQTVTLRTDGLGTTVSLCDATTDKIVSGAAGGAFSEKLAGLDLRIWKLVPAATGVK